MTRSNQWRPEEDELLDDREHEPAPGRRPLTLSLPPRIQRAPAPGAAPAAAPAAGAAPAAAPGAAADAVIVDDGANLEPGQLGRTAFLQQLQQQVTATASDALGPVASAVGCPYIESWFRTHAQTPAAELDRLARRYSGIAAPKTAAEMIPSILARVRSGIERWKAGENVSGDAAAAGIDVGGGGPAPAAAGGPVVQRKASGAASAEASAESGSPAAVLQALGGGSALDGSHGARIGAAMGDDFGDVRVHTDSAAAQQASDLGARAFTVGTHVAFAAGEYQPGTPEGDALLAHELAHVQQQRGGAIDATARKKADLEGPEGPLEQEADQVAAAAITQLHGGASTPANSAKVARGKSSLRSTLSLKRCQNSPAPPAPAPAPKSAASGDPDLMKGTQPPDETQQQDVNKILNPTATGSGTPAKKFDPKNFQTEMTAAMTKWMNDAFKFYDHLDKGGPDVIKLDMPQVRQTGKAAQQVVNAKWGGMIKSATSDPGTATSDPAYDVSDPKVLHPQEDTIDKVSKKDQDAVVRGLVEYGMRQTEGGKPVATAHNLFPSASRPDDVKAQNDFIDSFVKASGNYAKLAQIQRMWPGEEHPWDHTIYIQLRRQKDAELEKKAAADPKLVDAHLRQGYWASFQTLIHEYIHAAAHANYVRNEGAGSQDQILAEGGDDWLVTQLWKELEPKIGGDDALRLMVEGKKYDYSKEVIPGLSRYDEWKDVDAFIKKLGPGGEQNFLAAYFMGHVELIGLGTWKKGMVGDIDTYPVIVADFPPSLVAERTFVDEATIRTANKLGPTDKLPIGNAKVPGIAWHYCIPKDNLSAIAKQHGVTEDALKKANPVVSSWASLLEGEKILIPKH